MHCVCLKGKQTLVSGAFCDFTTFTKVVCVFFPSSSLKTGARKATVKIDQEREMKKETASKSSLLFCKPDGKN